jgi:uncharacterized protein
VADVSEERIPCDGISLDAFLMTPEKRHISGRPGLVLCHGFPSPQQPGAPSDSYRLLAERVSDELGWAVLAVSLRGCGRSEGWFSLEGWVRDLRAAVDHLYAARVHGAWIAGSTMGGSLAILAGAADPDVRGVACIAPRADFDDWAREPRRFLQHCRDAAVIDEDHPAVLGPWVDQLRLNRPIDHIEALSDRPVLILHGDRDVQVPPDDARALADAHGGADIRIIRGGDHRLRHDPRAVALLLGWLSRQSGERQFGLTAIG